MNISTDRAAQLIRAGQNVAIPTETVYGLAADATNAVAVRNTFSLKKRPADNPLIVHLSNPEQVEHFSSAGPEQYQNLAKTFWPGPLTLILPKKPHVLDIITAGLNTVALRMPDHPKALEIIDKAGPVTAPSANLSGRPSPTRPAHILQDFGDDFPVVDGGECSIGIESTVLDISGGQPAILRPGKLTAKELSKCIGQQVSLSTESDPQKAMSPGTRYTHYQPAARVRWIGSPETERMDENTLYIFHSTDPALNRHNNLIHFNGDFNRLAQSLYDLYRTADMHSYSEIRIESLPKNDSHPILPALYNRIERSVAQ
ncbi:MAG: L-threonylcarbamoyladenylate synthase [Balneolaceae bacterium]